MILNRSIQFPKNYSEKPNFNILNSLLFSALVEDPERESNQER